MESNVRNLDGVNGYPGNIAFVFVFTGDNGLNIFTAIPCTAFII